MKLNLKTYLFILVLLTSLVACSPKPKSPQPPEINYGQEMCSACGMVIDDAHFAAATLLANGKYLKFDDVGEMLSYHKSHPEEQVTAWFVHDYPSEKWIRGEQAIFVHSPTLQTPMGGGIAAFADQTQAKAFAAEHNGTIGTLENIRPQSSMVKKP